MAFNFPWSNLHELNLDWILRVVKRFSELVPPMETAVEDVQALQGDVAQAVEDAQSAVTAANQAAETASEALEVAEQAAQGTIADGAVTTTKLANDAVTGAKIADGAVTGNKIGQATIQTGNLSQGCVTSIQILDGEVNTADLHDGAVTTIKINDNAVTETKLSTELQTKINSALLLPNYLIRSISIPYSIDPNGRFNTSLGTAVDNDIPSGYKYAGVSGYTTGNNSVVALALYYGTSNYSLHILNLGSSAVTGNFAFEYIAVPLTE